MTPMTHPTADTAQRITVGELAVRFLEASGVKTAYGVISIHNMPILDAMHQRGQVRFVSARGEAGACNMADAAARVSATWGVCITSTGTGAGNAAGALVEALTAGTPMLHLTGQIESQYVDRDWGYIHEAPAQLAMLSAVSKAAFRIRDAQCALSILREAHRLAHTCTTRCAGGTVAIRATPLVVAGRGCASCGCGGATLDRHGLGRGHIGAGPWGCARAAPDEFGGLQCAKTRGGLVSNG